MRRVLVMVFAVAVFMGLGTTGAMAQPKAPSCGKSGCEKPKKCKAGEVRKHGKCVPKPEKCEKGEVKDHGKCVPKPPVCEKDEISVDDKCVPTPPVCADDEINVDGTCVPRPEGGPCAKADLVLLEDLLPGTGALACVYLFDNAPNASAKPGGDCPDALLALPLDNLLGACVFLPPADVGEDATATSAASLPALSEATGDTGLTGAASGVGLEGIVSLITGLLKFG
jgi:hypothetical protein